MTKPAPTALDLAHAEMTGAPDDLAARQRFHERLADCELFVLLDESEDEPTPLRFDTGDGSFVLAFDREERLADFTGTVSAYAALSGRTLVAQIEGSGLGIALNPGVAPSEHLVSDKAISWLREALGHRPPERQARLREVASPIKASETLLRALDVKLASARGLVRQAYLVATTDDIGETGLLLAFVDARKGAEDALSRAANEAVLFSGAHVLPLDVGFFEASHPMIPRLRKVGLCFDLPEAPAPQSPNAPGRDPAKPPRLR